MRKPRRGIVSTLAGLDKSFDLLSGFSSPMLHRFNASVSHVIGLFEMTSLPSTKAVTLSSKVFRGRHETVATRMREVLELLVFTR